MSVELNKDPYQHKEIYGFMFNIVMNDQNSLGVDQWGGSWMNIAPNPHSIILDPVDPCYLDIFMDFHNSLLEYRLNQGY